MIKVRVFKSIKLKPPPPQATRAILLSFSKAIPRGSFATEIVLTTIGGF